jgi:hypothetical protein
VEEVKRPGGREDLRRGQRVRQQFGRDDVKAGQLGHHRDLVVRAQYREGTRERH